MKEIDWCAYWASCGTYQAARVNGKTHEEAGKLAKVVYEKRSTVDRCDCCKPENERKPI